MIGLGVTGPNIVGTVGTATAGAISTASSILKTTEGISSSIPVIGQAVAGIVALTASILGALGVGQGCGQTCVQATSIVNQAEPILRQNLAAYQSGQIDQATAISNYNQVWQSVLTACAAIPGVAGQNCVGDRQQGACHYKDATGNCWNWYVGYYVPLLTVIPSNTTNTTSLTSLVSGGSSSLMIAAALGVVGLIMVIK